MFGRHKLATLVAEFIGTGVLTLLILTVQRSTIGVPFFIAATAGLAVVLMSFALGTASKAHFNPAITLGFWTARKIETVTAVLYIVVQLLGAYAAYYLYTYLVGNSLQNVGGEFAAKILVAEVVGTAIFAFGFAAAVYQGVSRATAAAYVGLALMIGILASSSASLGLLNPAVALGIKAWVWGTYVLGPILGAIIGVNLYAALFSEEGLKIPKATSTAKVTTTKKTTKKKSTKK